MAGVVGNNVAEGPETKSSLVSRKRLQVVMIPITGRW